MNARGCPYLGLEIDPSTYHAYASVANYCHKARQPGPVDPEYQSAVCLTDHYPTCPIYSGEEVQPVKTHPPLIPAGAGKLPQSILMLGGLALIIFLVILVFPGADGIGAFFQSASPTPTPTRSKTPEDNSLIVPSLTPTYPNLSFPLVIREPSVTPLPSLTFTPIPTVTRTPPPTDRPTPRATQSRYLQPTLKPVKPTKTAAPPEPPAFRPTATP